jgi:8-oxo-dGTP pyrophosphatase MutT (NUDIX family)
MIDQQTDLTLLLNDTFLNIRVAILLETPNGFVFERSKDGYLFALGGRVKINETSEEAAAREIFEELKLTDLKLDLISIIENFFSVDNGKKYHEINFVYRTITNEAPDLSQFVSDSGNVGYAYIKKEDFENYDIRPRALKELIKSVKAFTHLVNKSN